MLVNGASSSIHILVLIQKCFIMLAVDHPLEKQPSLPTVQWHWNVYNKTNAACFFFLSHSLTCPLWLTHSLTPVRYRKQGVSECEGGERERWKKNLLYLGAVEENAREIENGRSLVTEGHPLRSSRERCCLAGSVRALPVPDMTRFQVQTQVFSLWFDVTATFCSSAGITDEKLTLWQNEQG